ncbi:phosphatidic acid phosphatase type 2/haloperoxidase [Leptodontidium sp. MPI-SDFR-AT-0119]|nr:phosphatidic acid phosphatase type 2/haloperoxidase [Leptodontidium sp. MPI-SDFR-AT-0119]
MSKPRKTSWRLVLSYILDWALMLVGGIITASFRLLRGPKTEFSLLEPTINFPYHPKQLIPIWLAITLSPVVPTIIILITCIVFPPSSPLPSRSSDSSSSTPARKSSRSRKSRASHLHNVALGLGYTILFAFGISNILEKFTGQPRPDLIARCQVAPETYLDDKIMLYGAGMVSVEVCMQTDKFLLDEGWASFPSGHSSVDFAGLTYLSLFLAHRISVIGSRNHYQGMEKPSARASQPLYKLLILFIPIAIATGVSVTRILDNRHHPFDVLFGSALGMGCALLGHRAVLRPHLTSVGYRTGGENGGGEGGRRSEDLESVPLARIERA